MTTIKTYASVIQADMDKSLLEAAGIEAFLADENSAAIGYGPIVEPLRLQVQDADAEKARNLLKENMGGVPLSNDFVPPKDTPENVYDRKNLPPIRPIILLFLALIVLAFLAYLLRHQFQGHAHLNRFLLPGQ